MQLQRVHQDPSGRRVFDCADYAGDLKLETCLNDEDRLRPSERGPTVTKVQKGLRADREDVGPGTMTKLDGLCPTLSVPPVTPPAPIPISDDLIVKFAKSSRDAALRVAGNKLRDSSMSSIQVRCRQTRSSDRISAT